MEWKEIQMIFLLIESVIRVTETATLLKETGMDVNNITEPCQ